MEDFYTVYDNTTDGVVAQGTWAEVEDYFQCQGRYTVVNALNGQVIE